MKAVFHHNGNGRIFLRYAAAVKPQPGPLDLLIRVELISFECVDIHAMASLAPVEQAAIPGCQAMGIVVATGSKVTRFIPGDRVVGYRQSGALAEYFVASETCAWRVPDGLDPAFAAAIPHTFASAHDTLFRRGRLQAGETVLINGVTSPTALVALQMAVEAGARVIGVAADGTHRQTLAALGLSCLIERRSEDMLSACLEATNGRGVDFALDTGMGTDVETLTRLVVTGGRLAAFHPPEPPATRIETFAIEPCAPLDDPRLHALVERKLRRVARGELSIPVEHEFALCETADAYAYIMRGGVYGRVVLRP